MTTTTTTRILRYCGICRELVDEPANTPHVHTPGGARLAPIRVSALGLCLVTPAPVTVPIVAATGLPSGPRF